MAAGPADATCHHGASQRRDVKISSVKVGSKDAIEMVTETNGNTRVSLFVALPEPAD